MASSGFDTLKEVVVRSSQAGRLRVDLALLVRERELLFADLGRRVADLMAEGAIELPLELRRIYDRIHEVEARIQQDSGRAHDNAFGAPRGYEPEAGDYFYEHEEDEHARGDEEDPLASPSSRKARATGKNPR